MTMKVLFVDDEACVLEGIERMLFTLGRDWDVRFAGSGNDALDLLSQEDADIVVSDMRMPGMDGAELLRQVQARWPDTLRVVLSGHAEQEAALRAITIAHRYLSKPCDGSELVSAIEKLHATRRLLHTTAAQKLLSRIGELPAAPTTYLALCTALQDPNCDSAALSVIVNRDPAISAKVLKLANSALFWRDHPITSIQAAVTRLGTAMLRSLVLASEAFCGKPGDERVETMRLQAVRASLLARQLAPEGVDRETCATAALLAHIGMLLPAVAASVEAGTDAQIGDDDYPCHAQIGAYLLATWGLPGQIIEAVEHHHCPQRVLPDGFAIAGVVHVAFALAADEEPRMGYLENVGVDTQWPQWQQMARTLDDEHSH